MGRLERRDLNGAAPVRDLVITMAFFGSAFASSKTVVSEIPHDAAASLRFGGGAIVLVLVLIARPGRPSFSWTDVRAAGMVGLIGVFAYNFFYFWGVSLAPAIDGSVIVPAISPVLTTLFCIATGRETSSAGGSSGLASRSPAQECSSPGSERCAGESRAGT